MQEFNMIQSLVMLTSTDKRDFPTIEYYKR